MDLLDRRYKYVTQEERKQKLTGTYIGSYEIGTHI